MNKPEEIEMATEAEHVCSPTCERPRCIGKRLFELAEAEHYRFNFPAAFTMTTVSGTTDCCVKHAKALEGIMRMLGAFTQATRAPYGAVCTNCINEAKNRSAKSTP